MINLDDTCGCGRSKKGACTGPHHESYCDEYARTRGAELPTWRDDDGKGRVLSLELEGMRLILHRLIHHPGWYCSMQDDHRDLFRDRTLTEDDIDIEDAKVLALRLALTELQERTERYEEMIETFGRLKN